MDMWETMENVDLAIFALETNKIGQYFGQLIEQMSPLMAGLQETQLLEVNQTLTAMLAAMEHQDYLLLSDLMRFQLQPFLKSILS